MSNINPIIIKAAVHKDSPLTPESAADIQIYLTYPNEQNWHIIAHLHIIGMTTLWQAILKIDENFTQTGRTHRALYPWEEQKKHEGASKMVDDWPEIPEPKIVLKAIEAETKRGREIV